jgi:hypothetical protein
MAYPEYRHVTTAPGRAQSRRIDWVDIYVHPRMRQLAMSIDELVSAFAVFAFAEAVANGGVRPRPRLGVGS